MSGGSPSSTGWVDSQAYLDAVEQALTPMRGTSQYEAYRYAWLDHARFGFFIDQLERFTPVAGKRVFDSGCGAGGLCVALKERGAREVTGFELSEVSGPLVEERLKGRPGFKTLRKLEELGALPARSFDAIFSLHVVEHVDDAAAYLAELRRLLTDAGWLFIATPNRLWPVEQHTGIPLLHYLPRGLALGAGQALASAPLLSSDLRRRLREIADFKLFYFFQMRQAVRRAGFEILDHNRPETIPDRLQRRGLKSAAMVSRALPRSALSTAAMVGSPSINLICRAR